MKTALLIIIVTVSTMAEARYYHGSCVQTMETLLEQKYVNTSGCSLNEPLGLVQSWFNYFYFKDNPYLVRFWQGSYKKTYQQQSHFRRQVVDSCRGTILSDETISYLSPQITSTFEILNPNLDPGIASTIQLAPLTEAEATEALKQKLMECEGFNP